MLYLGVRNKYCATCARALRNKISPPEHICSKNWDESSSAMESNIIAEGFRCSVKNYGVKYHQVIADGDSNVYKTILDTNPYDTLIVEKIECKNHLLRNFCNKLKELAANGKLRNVSARKEISLNVLRVRNCIAKATEHRKKENIPFGQKVKLLKGDILNCMHHVMGDHEKCASYFCEAESAPNNTMQQIRGTELYFQLMSIMNSIADHSKSLLNDATNNIAEEFNSIIAKFLGGKRVNFCLGNSYKARCNAAAVSHNTRTPHSQVLRIVNKSSPGRYVKKYEKTKCLVRKAAAKRKALKSPIARKTLFPKSPRDTKSYGPLSQKPDMSPEDFSEQKDIFLSSLKVTPEQQAIIEKETRLQRDSPSWLFHRRKRLTASHFGSVCIRLQHTSCKNLVKAILYSSFDNRALRYCLILV